MAFRSTFASTSKEERVRRTARIRGEQGRKAQLRWAVHKNTWIRAHHGIYLAGGEPPSEVESALALREITGGVAAGGLAGVLHGLDAVTATGHVVTVPLGGSQRDGVQRRQLTPSDIELVEGIPCTTPTRTLTDLAAALNDRQWEWALESALRQRLCTVAQLETALERRRVGNPRMRRILDSRPPGAPPTESLLETLAVQLIRDNGISAPLRQVEVVDDWNHFVARVDLAWPDLGVFLELDGQHHRHQPVHDARRETAVVASTGWLPGRFTWTEVTRHPVATARRIEALLDRATQPHSTHP